MYVLTKYSKDPKRYYLETDIRDTTEVFESLFRLRVNDPATPEKLRIFEKKRLEMLERFKFIKLIMGEDVDPTYEMQFKPPNYNPQSFSTTLTKEDLIEIAKFAVGNFEPELVAPPSIINDPLMFDEFKQRLMGASQVVVSQIDSIESRPERP